MQHHELAVVIVTSLIFACAVDQGRCLSFLVSRCTAEGIPDSLRAWSGSQISGDEIPDNARWRESAEHRQTVNSLYITLLSHPPPFYAPPYQYSNGPLRTCYSCRHTILSRASYLTFLAPSPPGSFTSQAIHRTSQGNMVAHLPLATLPAPHSWFTAYTTLPTWQILFACESSAP